MIVRVFKATIHPGKNDEFKKFFTEIAIPLVKQQEGLIDLFIGLPIDETSNVFMMTSFWKDINAIKKFSGEQWQNAVIDEREKHLVKSAAMEHYYKYE
ncbi:MAG: antibiotic biosynthesis monooxygenase [Chitinophagales bacterium]|nr:antibiotic biosynthesis monooxygenase [Chitinophagales bacterium]